MWWLGSYGAGWGGANYMRFQVSTLILKIYIQVKLKIFTSLRCYWTTNSLFTWGDAQNFCETLGLGLVKWDTADIYLDLKYLSNQFEFWTALTNTNEEECDTRSLGPSACNGLLVRAKYQKNPMVYQNNLSLIAMAANIWWAKWDVLRHPRVLQNKSKKWQNVPWV